ncbi:hypothetical protein GPECTOR_33g567 [Gonium pectorale]|uniref:Uncharacterized protein n=1 Tax=Gonium pectorale TaxID=33097 RepID=A0A150GDL8_GONPE|nr:hypothetical protein GPECTOR_33g567 [Gonium pectorale]|eukprot:KXZ47685.1 hypothetical protein GPECTOR_33g567 [Gonium pectorale]
MGAVTEMIPVQVERVSDHALLELPTAWGPEQGAELYFVSCGATRDLDRWLEYTSFPADHTFMDQANAVYDALRTRRGVGRTLLHPYVSGGRGGRMWFVLPFRLLRRGTLGGLGAALRVWKPRVPEKNIHSFLQGGTFVFRGPRLMWAHRNAVPGDDPPLEQVLAAVDAALRGSELPWSEGKRPEPESRSLEPAETAAAGEGAMASS